jgi:Transcriptional regulators
MVTIKEIAKACNVSIATVSNILNNKSGASKETRKRVLQVIEEMHYTPNHVAKNLKMRNTRSIGVIAEDMTIFSIPDIIDGITEYCEEEDYQILLVNLRLFKKYEDTYYNRDDYFEAVEREIQKLMAKQVEGIIYVAAHERVIKCIPENLPIPAVMAYGYTQVPSIPSIVVNDEEGAYQIVDYAIAQGHKRIGVITGKRDSVHMQARLEGYQRAIYENHLLYDPHIIKTGDWTRSGGYGQTDDLLAKDVTAIYCMNDLMAGGVYDRLAELGKMVGRDLSVFGYDGRELSSYYNPPLTTIKLPLHDIGYKASEIILSLLKGETLERKNGIYPMPCVPVIRTSIKKIT